MSSDQAAALSRIGWLFWQCRSITRVRAAQRQGGVSEQGPVRAAAGDHGKRGGVGGIALIEAVSAEAP